MFLVCVCAAALLREPWEALAAKLNQTQQQIRACEAAMVFAFVEVKTLKGHFGCYKRVVK